MLTWLGIEIDDSWVKILGAFTLTLAIALPSIEYYQNRTVKRWEFWWALGMGWWVFHKDFGSGLINYLAFGELRYYVANVDQFLVITQPPWYNFVFAVMVAGYFVLTYPWWVRQDAEKADTSEQQKKDQ